MAHIVIIGNGVTGSTVARHVRKLSDHKITMISSETEHFYSRTALMYIFMGHMKYEHTKPYEDWFWKKNRIELVFDHVERVDYSGKKLSMKSGKSISYDKLVLAVGSKSNFFGWKGQELEGVQGMYGMPDLDKMERNTKNIKHAVVVGGGLIGIEMVEMLLSRDIPVSFLVREKMFWSGVLLPEESGMVERHIREHHVDLQMQTELDEIIGDGNGKVKAIRTKSGELIETQFVGLTVGVKPNIDFLREGDLECNKGILVNHLLETNIPDVYSAGDCAEFREPLPDRRPVEQVWYTGKMQAEHLARTLCGNPIEYQPGIWFNSAKFFDIEYQNYGPVLGKLKDGEDSLYWEHPSGKKSVRIVYEQKSKQIRGFNLMGIRGRHAVCEHWIEKNSTLEEVVSNLGALNFDPEFYQGFEKGVVKLYNRKFPEKQIELKTKKGLFSRFLQNLYLLDPNSKARQNKTGRGSEK